MELGFSRKTINSGLLHNLSVSTIKFSSQSTKEVTNIIMTLMRAPEPFMASSSRFVSTQCVACATISAWKPQVFRRCKFISGRERDDDNCATLEEANDRRLPPACNANKEWHQNSELKFQKTPLILNEESSSNK